MIKKLIYFAAFLVFASTIFTSCKKSETYAEMKEKEKAAIEDYIATYGVKVISEETFKNQGCTTDTAKNEFVLFESSGIYLQIIRKGGADGQDSTSYFKPLHNGESCTILCRFTEWTLYDMSSVQLSNDTQYYASIPETMTVTNSSGTFSGSFDTVSSLMYSKYSSQAVPSAWLYPLTYVNLGRPRSDTDAIAKVKIIAPSAQGQYDASSNVYPCLYILTYEKYESD